MRRAATGARHWHGPRAGGHPRSVCGGPAGGWCGGARRLGGRATREHPREDNVPTSDQPVDENGQQAFAALQELLAALALRLAEVRHDLSVARALPSAFDIRFVFNLIYQNNLPESVKYYFTDVFLFCLHKDPNDHTKLRPLGIPTAIRRLIGTHVARTLHDKFATHLLPFNFAVGVPDGSDFVVKAMQLAIEKYIDCPQQKQASPLAPPSSSTSRINSTVSLGKNSRT